MMKVFKYLLLILLLAAPVLADTLPPIGDIMWNSTNERSKLKTGCFLTYDLGTHKFRCAKTRVVAEFDTEALAINKSVIPTITCPSSGAPCRMTFLHNPAGQEYGGTDFIMPDSPLDPMYMSLNIVSDFANDDSVWQADWCQYAVGDPPCAPSGANLIEDPIVMPTTAGDRKDVLFKFGVCCTNEEGTSCTSTVCSANGACSGVSGNPTCVLPTWDVNNHIVIIFTRLYNDAGDDHDHPIYVEGAKIEFSSPKGEP